MTIDWDGLLNAPLAAVFGEGVQYGRPNQPAFSAVGVFDRFHAELRFDESEVPISTHRVLLGVQASAFPAGFAPEQGDRVIARGAAYEVVDVRRDPIGGFTLELMKR